MWIWLLIPLLTMYLNLGLFGLNFVIWEIDMIEKNDTKLSDLNSMDNLYLCL